MTSSELSVSTHDLHQIDWRHTNASPPISDEQCEYWQFRISKSKGRVIGFLIDGVFYVVWLDPHHNLTNSEGYGTENRYKAGMSIYEITEIELQHLRSENERLQAELRAAEELLRGC
jgi:hypothetical protein